MATSPLPFSSFRTAGNLIFTSGQIHLQDGKLVGETVEEMTRQVMKNLQAILEKAGVGFEDVVNTTIYLTDMGMYGQVNEVYRSYFKEVFPARTCVCVKELPLGAKIEVQMVASKG